MVPGREFQTCGATHAKLRQANVVRNRGRLRRLQLLDPSAGLWISRDGCIIYLVPEEIQLVFG